MSSRGSLGVRALVALVVSQLLLGVAAATGGGVGLLLAGLGALVALILAGLWYARGDKRLLYGALAAGGIGLLVPLEQPLGGLERGLALAGALALLAFLEYGHLTHRIERLGVGEEQTSVRKAMRSRLSRTLAIAALLTGGVVGLTAVPGPWFSKTFARSVERGGPLGVLLVGGAAATLTVAIARLRLFLAQRRGAGDPK